MVRLSVPAAGRLSPSLRLDASSSAVLSILSRLSRASLISVALDWLDDQNAALALPYLSEGDPEEDMGDFYPPAASVDELRETYREMQNQKGSKRDVVDRITEGDWRHGISLYQLAAADLQYMRDHPNSHKWTAYKICALQTPASPDEADEPPRVDALETEIPRFHPATFVRNLQAQALPDMKVHFAVERPEGMNFTLVRILVLESPYVSSAPSFQNSGPSGLEPSQTVYLGFPDASPHVFIARSASGGTAGASESNSLRKILLQGIPKALSRSRQRYMLKPTNLTSRSLPELLDRKGPGRTNSAGGGWGVYADTKKPESPLDTVTDSETHQPNGSQEPPISKLKDPREWAKKVAESRFGPSGNIDDGKGVERVDVILEDPPSTLGDGDDDEEEPWNPNVRLVLQGPHVFAGIRQLVEAGVVDGERMPGWMTGEEGITLGIVRDGRMRGHGEEPIS